MMSMAMIKKLNRKIIDTATYDCKRNFGFKIEEVTLPKYLSARRFKQYATAYAVASGNLLPRNTEVEFNNKGRERPYYVIRLDKDYNPVLIKYN